MKFLITILVVLVSLTALVAQDAVKSDVHLFQTLLRDAPITSRPYGDAAFTFSDYKGGSAWGIGFQGGYPVNPQLEVGVALGFLNFSPEFGDGESGLSDITVAGHYLLKPENPNMSAGGYITLPVGKEEIGQGNLNFGAFGAMRYPMTNGIVLTGILGFDFLEMTTYEFNTTTLQLEEKSSHELSVLIGGGAIYPVNEQFHVVGELNFQTEGDYALLSGGVDYTLGMGNKIRGALGFGLDDGAPDLMLMGSFMFFLK